MKKIFTLLTLSLLSAYLSACTGFNNDRATQFQSLTSSQQAAYWQKRNVMYLMRQLQQQGATVYHYGDAYQIIIPTSKLFNGETTLVSNSADSLIKALVKFINAQPTAEVRVLAYTNHDVSKEANFALTQSWGEALVNKLRESGLIAGVLSAQGHGECDNIGKDNTFTSRVEIHYRIAHEY
jgi:outer membrane protein OmpA-like peptidoglycan-associated protein